MTESFGAKLRRHRLLSGKRQVDVADDIGWSQERVSHAETGHYGVPRDAAVVTSIAHAVEGDPDEFCAAAGILPVDIARQIGRCIALFREVYGHPKGNGAGRDRSVAPTPADGDGAVRIYGDSVPTLYSETISVTDMRIRGRLACALSIDGDPGSQPHAGTETGPKAFLDIAGVIELIRRLETFVRFRERSLGAGERRVPANLRQKEA